MGGRPARAMRLITSRMLCVSSACAGRERIYQAAAGVVMFIECGRACSTTIAKETTFRVCLQFMDVFS